MARKSDDSGRRLAEAIASGADKRDIPLENGGRIRYRRVPAPGVAYSLTHVSPEGAERLSSLMFEATSTPPERYPADAPFVPGQSVMVMFATQGWGTMAWEGIEDVDAFRARIVGDGPDRWEFGDAPAASLFGSTGFEVWQLHRGDAKRMLTIVRGRAGSSATLMSDELMSAARPADR